MKKKECFGDEHKNKYQLYCRNTNIVKVLQQKTASVYSFLFRAHTVNVSGNRFILISFIRNH